MSTSQVAYQRKRRRSQQSPDDSKEPLLKRPKHCSSPSLSEPPVHYLDTLSTIRLTREALRELDRKTRRAKSHHQRRPEYRRPLTRGYRAELRSRVRSTPKTVKDLKQFARHGGPDLLDLRGCSKPAFPSRYTMSSSQFSRLRKRGARGSVLSSQVTPTTTNTIVSKKSTGSYNPNFRQRMVDSGIYHEGYEYPDGQFPPEPSNLDELQQMIAKPRLSLPPPYPEELFKEFKRANARVSSESKATKEVIPLIQGAGRNSNLIGGDNPFNNVNPMMAGKDHDASPDVYYGARPEELNRAIRENSEEGDDIETRKKKLGRYIVPSTKDTRPIAPNCFIETKQPGASAAVALDQACFAGAVGARGMHKLLMYGQETPKYNNEARTLSFTYHDGTFKMFSHHVGQPNGPGTPPEYYMIQLKAWAMTSDPETMVKGMTGYRNAVDWAEEQRKAAIEHANAVASDINNDGDDNDEEEDEDDEDNEDSDKEDDESDKLTATAVDPILGSFMSESSFSAGQTSRRSRMDHQVSDTSSDELDCRNSKRSKRGKHSRQKKFDSGQSSSQHSITSTANQQVLGWAWKDGAFGYYNGQNAPCKSQSTTPTDAWVYCEYGWPDGGGKKWRWVFATTKMTQYQ